MDGVAANADTRALPEPRRRELVHGLIGQRPGAAHQPDAAGAVDVAGHDPDLALAGADNARAVGAHEQRAAFPEEGFHPHHIQNRDMLGDDHHEPDARLRRFTGRVRRQRRGHERHTDVGPGLADGLSHRIEHRHAERGLPAPPGGHAADHASPVADHPFRMELPFPTGDALHQHPAPVVYQDTHTPAS